MTAITVTPNGSSIPAIETGISNNRLSRTSKQVIVATTTIGGILLFAVLLFVLCRRRTRATAPKIVRSHPEETTNKVQHFSMHSSNNTSMVDLSNSIQIPTASTKQDHLRNSNTQLDWASPPVLHDSHATPKHGLTLGYDLPQKHQVEPWPRSPQSPRLDSPLRHSFRSSTNNFPGFRGIASWIRLHPLRIDEEQPRPTAQPLMTRIAQLKNQASAPVLSALPAMYQGPAKPAPTMPQTRIGTLSSIFRPSSRPSSPASGWRI